MKFLICEESDVKDQAPGVDADLYIALLLKDMLVHGCEWNDMGKRLSRAIENSEIGEAIAQKANDLYSRRVDIANEINRQYKKLISCWLGYGMPDIDRVLACTKQWATLLGFGQLAAGTAHVFRLPLPPSISFCREQRRLIVTLAWLSPFAPSTQKYR